MELATELGGPIEPDTIVDYMLESRAKWNAVGTYVRKILSTKEKEERTTQRNEDETT